MSDSDEDLESALFDEIATEEEHQKQKLSKNIKAEFNVEDQE